MCALFGFLNYGKKVSWRTLQKLVQALANASEVRGSHAAGIAYNHDDQLRIFKRPRPAHKLHFHIPHGTAAVMGHEDDLYTHWYGYGGYYNRWKWNDPFADCRSDDEDYLLLIELSGYYGVDPEDIRTLRDMGYSFDEIEAFLMDPDSYSAELALAEL